MKKLRKQTLIGMRDQLGGHPWTDAEIDELVAPKLGIITGLGELLEQLEALRAIDLEDIPPAGDIPRP